ncbi:short chain dehydrogenase [Coniochaeta ligniaria NRRL 30616]|uniref:Short chain dehydrogenase n=1 Tax=Coniochaeta ligniaria NRRL 30616 TaxID=1408157 RepID=A0A1J7I511_9PEZI|nr:short chain dehydrogenase [Coniochaeta ligniaria NRRL 30616]
MAQVQPRNIVLTGAARGIGRALARHLYLGGHKLFLIDVDGDELSHTANVHLPSALKSQSVSSCTADLRDVKVIQSAIQQAAQFLDGRIDVLINNAGIARAMWTDSKTMEDDVLDEWQAYVETNLTAPFVISRACIPYMKSADKSGEGEGVLSKEVSGAGELDRAPSACIINISSFRARQSQANCEGYGATKAGLLGLTHAMAISGAQWGIRSNAILPGYIEVKHECKQGDEEGKKWAESVDEARHRKHPVGRVGYGEDIAKTVDWLMDAGFVTGQEIVVDGGVSKIKYDSS